MIVHLHHNEIPAPDPDADRAAVYEVLALAYCGMYIANANAAHGMHLQGSTFGHFYRVVQDLLDREVVRVTQDLAELNLQGNLRHLTSIMPDYFEIL